MDNNSGAERHQAKAIIFRLLKFRLRSEHELVVKLAGKGISQETTRQVIDHFKKVGLIDDQLFARGWVASRLNKPVGLIRIRRELRQKGVADDIVDAAVARGVRDYDERETVLSLAQRRLGQYRSLPRATAQRRLFQYLARRGFPLGLIQNVLREIF